MKLSKEHELALRAALLPAPRSVESWNTLVEMIPIEDLDGSITRIMPAIYQNIGTQLSVNGLPKLKGSYLFAWARNTEFTRNLKPLLLALEKTPIEYRILKGGALNFLFQSLGLRSMGDVDFLIGKKDLATFHQLLEETGFRRKFSDSCPHIKSGNSDPELNFVNSENIELDLHIMEDRRPKLLFELALKSPANVCEFMGTKIKLPPTEILILHTIYHGKIGVQTSDEIQSLLDTKRLIRFAETEELTRLSEKLHFVDLLENYLDSISYITGETFDFATINRRRIWHRFRYKMSGMGIFLERLKDLGTIRKSRSIGGERLFSVLRHFRGHRITYCLWLATGKLRPLERFCWHLSRGFLKHPSGTISSNPDIEYPVTYSHGLVSFNSLASQSQDWRFSLRTPSEAKKISISMFSLSFQMQSFLVFVNGQVAGVTDRNSLGTHTLVIHNPSSVLEISLRLPASGCEACALKLEDLVLRFI